MERRFLKYLKDYHRGKENAVSSGYLQNKLSISSRTIRKIVNQLRNDGIPICSDEDGYYYAGNTDEVLGSIYQMSSRIKEIAKAKNGLIKSLDNLPDKGGQLSLIIFKYVKGGDEI